MKEAKRIVVTSLGIILLAGIFSIPPPTDRAAAAEPLGPLEAENKALRAQVKSLQRQTKELKAQLARLEPEFAGLKPQLAGLKAEVAALEAEVATLKAQNAEMTLKAEVAKLKRGPTVSGAKARTRPASSTQPAATNSADSASIGIGVSFIDTRTFEAWRKAKIAHPPVRGLFVGKVLPGSPAERAGIKGGDIVAALIDRKIVGTLEGFLKWNDSLKIGQPTTVTVWRLETTSGGASRWKRRLIEVVPKSRKEFFMPPAVEKGTVEVSVQWASIGKAGLRNEATGAKTVSADKLLTIFVGIVNLSETRKLSYRTWGAKQFKFKDGSARLTDDLGNVYKRIHFGLMNVPMGRTDEESIYPLRSILDTLIFELPVARAKRLTLSLPLENLDQEGSIEIIIPAAAIQRD